MNGYEKKLRGHSRQNEATTNERKQSNSSISLFIQNKNPRQNVEQRAFSHNINSSSRKFNYSNRAGFISSNNNVVPFQDFNPITSSDLNISYPRGSKSGHMLNFGVPNSSSHYVSLPSSSFPSQSSFEYANTHSTVSSRNHTAGLYPAQVDVSFNPFFLSNTHSRTDDDIIRQNKKRVFLDRSEFESPVKKVSQSWYNASNSSEFFRDKQPNTGNAANSVDATEAIAELIKTILLQTSDINVIRTVAECLNSGTGADNCKNIVNALIKNVFQTGLETSVQKKSTDIISSPAAIEYFLNNEMKANQVHFKDSTESQDLQNNFSTSYSKKDFFARKSEEINFLESLNSNLKNKKMDENKMSNPNQMSMFSELSTTHAGLSNQSSTSLKTSTMNKDTIISNSQTQSNSNSLSELTSNQTKMNQNHSSNNCFSTKNKAQLEELMANHSDLLNQLDSVTILKLYQMVRKDNPVCQPSFNIEKPIAETVLNQVKELTPNEQKLSTQLGQKQFTALSNSQTNGFSTDSKANNNQQQSDKYNSKQCDLSCAENSDPPILFDAYKLLEAYKTSDVVRGKKH